MRICLYTDTALPKMGGQEGVVDALARCFQTLGHDVVVLAPYPRLPRLTRDRDLPYPVVRHPRFYSTRLFVSWYRWFLSRLTRRQRTDIIHCHGVYPPGYLAGLSAVHRGIPVVITSHGPDIHPDNRRLKDPRLRERIMHGLNRAAALVAISRITAENFRRLCPQQRIVAIPNGVDLSAYAQQAPRPSGLDPAIQPGEYMLFLGRLKNRKGVDDLLDALARLPGGAGETPQLVVAGEGEERAALERQCTALHLDHRVRFVGSVYHADKTYLLQNALCTVVPSRISEAFPLVVLESYAAGRPVVGTRIPGLEDLVEPEHTGWLVPENAPDAVASALHEAWEGRAQTRALGDNAQRMAQNYGWDSVAQSHLQLYEDLLCQAGRRHA